MAILKAKPTSPGRRFVVQVTNPDLHKGEPHAPLLEKKLKTGGRNNQGRITTRHVGGGHTQPLFDGLEPRPGPAGLPTSPQQV